MERERLGRFRIGELLGRGGMGAVYAALEDDTEQRVALKVLSAGLAEDEEKFRRFEQEVSALARLNHPNVVRLLGPIERDGDTIFFAMERLSGETLAARIRRDGPLPVPVVLSIVRPLLSALAAAHEAGVVHRDIKPSNIFLADDRVVVTDFGLARMEDITRLTLTGQLMGTLDYMSPEQCEGGEVDARTDLYSAGIVLFEMLAGEAPFRKASPGAVLHGHLHEEPERLDRIRADLPPGLADVVARLLAKDPEKRPASATAVLEDLSEVRDPSRTVTFHAGHGPAVPRSRPPVGRQTPRRWVRPAIAAALVLVLALVGLRILRGKDGHYPGRSTVETTLDTIHRAIRARDFPVFSDCFVPGALDAWFDTDPAAEFRARAAEVADYEYRAEIPIRGASDGEASVRILSGPALPVVLGLNASEPVRVLLQPEADGFRVARVDNARGGPGGPGGPGGGRRGMERERRMLNQRVEGFFRELQTRGPDLARRLVEEGRIPKERLEEAKARLTALLGEGDLPHEVLEEETRITGTTAVVVVRVPKLAAAFGLADDRFDLEFVRSALNSVWRNRGIRAHAR